MISDASLATRPTPSDQSSRLSLIENSNLIGIIQILRSSLPEKQPPSPEGRKRTKVPTNSQHRKLHLPCCHCVSPNSRNTLPAPTSMLGLNIRGLIGATATHLGNTSTSATSLSATDKMDYDDDDGSPDLHVEQIAIMLALIYIFR